MAPSSGAAGVAADHLEEKIPLSKHGPDPGTTACYLCAAGSTTRTSASSMRRILRRCGHSGRAGDQNHGSVIAFLPEGYVIRKHPGPMSAGCFRCAGCGDQRIVDEVKRIVHSRVRRGLRDMPVGEYVYGAGAARRLHAAAEVLNHAVLWHDLEHFAEGGADGAAEELPAELRTEHPVPFDEDTILSEHLQEAAYLMDVPNSAVTPESPIRNQTSGDLAGDAAADPWAGGREAGCSECCVPVEGNRTLQPKKKKKTREGLTMTMLFTGGSPSPRGHSKEDPRGQKSKQEL